MENEKKEPKKQNQSNFEEFWKCFPHARPSNKTKTKTFYLQQDHEVVMRETNILHLRIFCKLQETKYIPACERWIRDMVVTNDTMLDSILTSFVRWIKSGDAPAEQRPKHLETLYAVTTKEHVKEIERTVSKEKSIKLIWH